MTLPMALRTVHASTLQESTDGEWSTCLSSYFNIMSLRTSLNVLPLLPVAARRSRYIPEAARAVTNDAIPNAHPPAFSPERKLPHTACGNERTSMPQ